MTRFLQGKSAIVTGSTSGIGLVIAKSLAAEGVNIILNGLGEASAIESERAALEKQFGIRALYSNADMTKPDQIRALVALAEKEFGGPDILVNNAGIQHVAPITEFPEEKWDQILAINLSAVFHGTKAAALAMQKKQWGRIVNISSVHGLVASEFKSAYVAAKHGVVGLTKASALDLAQSGITVNAICPGYALTPLVEKQIPEQAKAHGISDKEVTDKVFLKEHAIKEFVSVEQIAGLVLYLCGDSARTTTGTAIAIDAGWSAH